MRMPRILSWLTPRGAGIAFIALFLLQITYLLFPYRQEPLHSSSGDRRSTSQQLADLRQAYNPHNVNASVSLVLASIHTDDLTWLLKHCKESTEKSAEQGLLVPPTRRGREVPAYLSYIVDFYDRLPDYSIFIHASPEQWHNDLFGPKTRDTLKHLRLEPIDVYGYVNLRCKHDPGCPTAVFPLSPSQIDIDAHDIRAYFSEAYQQILGVPAEQVPEAIGNVCCGQFAVSRERILARPKEDYERILNWAATTKLTDDFGVGWVLEKLWHIVFGMDAVYCPRYEQCRCDTYGWCGPLQSGEMLQPVMRSDV
ncbi:uncharacterized protein N7498_008675 [Penicillium cinerascens]|uniref:Uncharacterized protein n=1 Tax=Penicillium cinerascens TaxID=70096 RepID=A0A9W9JFX0_9EURO|nr:uncharacterized protein N7498_008675 [Penicillium cinerascens]KAJ5195237.1 hypothetical protein N7498_008675 [Penicillium cinerascens]